MPLGLWDLESGGPRAAAGVGPIAPGRERRVSCPGGAPSTPSSAGSPAPPSPGLLLRVLAEQSTARVWLPQAGGRGVNCEGPAWSTAGAQLSSCTCRGPGDPLEQHPTTVGPARTAAVARETPEWGDPALGEAAQRVPPAPRRLEPPNTVGPLGMGGGSGTALPGPAVGSSWPEPALRVASVLTQQCLRLDVTPDTTSPGATAGHGSERPDSARAPRATPLGAGASSGAGCGSSLCLWDSPPGHTLTQPPAPGGHLPAGAPGQDSGALPSPHGTDGGTSSPPGSCGCAVPAPRPREDSGPGLGQAPWLSQYCAVR